MELCMAGEAVQGAGLPNPAPSVRACVGPGGRHPGRRALHGRYFMTPICSWVRLVSSPSKSIGFMSPQRIAGRCATAAPRK